MEVLKHGADMIGSQRTGGEQCREGDAGDTGNGEGGRSVGVADESGEEGAEGRGNVSVKVEFSGQGGRRRCLGDDVRAEDEMVE